jgi:tetratricopeptide (TPR) repeat protein
VLAAILITLAWHTQKHVPVWRNDLTLWEATTPTCMESAYCHSGLGQALLSHGQPQRGGDELFRAVQLEPIPLYLMYFADALTISARNYPDAIRFYQAALARAEAPQSFPDLARISELYAKLARVYVLEGDLEEASRAIQAGKNAAADNPQLWVIETFLRWRQGNLEEARKSLGTALLFAGKTSQVKSFIDYYWVDAAETGRLLAELTAAASPPSTTEVSPIQEKR